MPESRSWFGRRSLNSTHRHAGQLKREFGDGVFISKAGWLMVATREERIDREQTRNGISYLSTRLWVGDIG